MASDRPPPVTAQTVAENVQRTIELIAIAGRNLEELLAPLTYRQERLIVMSDRIASLSSATGAKPD